MPLYQEVARPVGVEDMIRLWLDPRGEETRAWSSTAHDETSASATARN